MNKRYILSEDWDRFSTEKQIFQLRKVVAHLYERVEDLELGEMARADLEGSEEELSSGDLAAAAKKYIAAAKKRMETDDPKKIAAGLGATFRKAKDGAPVKIGKVEISDEDAAAFKAEVKKQLGVTAAPKKASKKKDKTEEELDADTKKKTPNDTNESGGDEPPPTKASKVIVVKKGSKPSFMEDVLRNAGLTSLNG